MKSIYKITILTLLGILVLTGCQDDFLDRPALSETNTENFYKTKQEIRLATAGLYGGKVWGQWHNQAYLPLGDILSGNLLLAYQGTDLVQLNTFTLSGSNGRLTTGWTALYIIVAHCNSTIKGINENTPATIAAADKNAGIAEARFIRAMAYYHLAMLWGEVPIIEDNTKLIQSPLVNKNKTADVYRFITEDLTFAAENLPATDGKGRVTSWSAKGMLSKVYLTMSGLGQLGGDRNQEYLNKAKLYAKDVVENSGLVLLPSYYDLFKTQFNDNPESLFALQWSSISSGWNEGNQLLTYSPSNDINPQKSSAWGSPSPSYDLYLAYTKQDSIRRKASIMLTGDHYAELNAAGGGYTAGAPGMKKHIIGNEVDNNSPAMTPTSSIEHNSLLRLADIYLIYAEAILGNDASTSNPDALLYFNKVRTRAGVDPVTVLNTDIILKERRVEFACEGQYWYDLVRLSYYNPQKAVDLLSNQQRVPFDYNADTEVAKPNDPIGPISPATFSTFTLQLPTVEVIANPKLNEPAVSYYK
ncbi:RagB/SusD family nutrient uptake outer membrane protein [Flavobacterium sp. ENC]|uniref:RagB/SusD family nutrient uptake outer membrane protein n=1 Tax=Flavobacterium sp. ENC TaxID=2897330 RepID=UPI001E63465F|nr:RagB/SusD family nutrient uptake outer membrane protein [Flavobacterium sp. ENC]MCD0465264.1 RagB/SusD family nutrient uptake outer membrane protein [Flavobacterium sp. ENC]